MMAADPTAPKLDAEGVRKVKDAKRKVADALRDVQQHLTEKVYGVGLEEAFQTLEMAAAYARHTYAAERERCEPPSDVELCLRVSDYEASILQGALEEFDPPSYPEDRRMALDLRRRVDGQIPAAWESAPEPGPIEKRRQIAAKRRTEERA